MANGNWAWQDLGTTDMDAARAFYASVFGWTFVPVPMGDFEYSMIYVGDFPIGGINGPGPDGNSRWIPYLVHDNLDQAIATIGSTGGTNDPGNPHHIPGIGRMSYHTDPDGAAFALFEGEGDWANHQMQTMGAVKSQPVWYELATESAAATIPWYQAFTGWGHQEWPMGEGMVYHGATVGDAPVAGIFDKAAFGDSGTPSQWRFYIEAPESAEASAAAVKAAGGTVIQEPAPIPGTGIFMVAKDPTGAVFGVLESEAM